MSDSVTNLLNAMSDGQAHARETLLPLIYQELRVVARSRLGEHRRGETLNTTGLVHEAYLKLVGGEKGGNWSNRHHFYATAALAMRQLLVDEARRRLAEKRGGGRSAITLDEQLLGTDGDIAEVVALDAALEQLKELDPALAELVELRFFLGLSVSEAADLLGASERTLARDWQKARAFLHAQLAE